MDISRLGCLIIIGALLSSCGGGGSGSGSLSSNTTNTGDSGNGTGGNGTGGGGTTQPVFSGFDFSLATANFWEYRWDYYENTWAQGSSPTTSRDNGRFWVVLGPSVQIQGITAYEVLIYGRSKKRAEYSTRTFGPRWKYVAIDGSKIYGSTDGSALTLIFDAMTGKWPGGGFFTTLPASTLNIAQSGAISSYNSYVTGTAIVAQRSSSQSQCEIYGDITICGDSSYNYNEEEYYRVAIGPLGYYYYNTFEDCGGGFCSGATWRHNAGLTASSFTSQSNPLVTESEPNDSPATAQQITTANPVIGSVSQSTLANLGNTVISVTVLDDSNNSVAIQPTVEDWYSFSLATAATITITLSFENTAGADLDIFLMNSAGTSLIAYGVHDNLNRQDQYERVRVTSLAAGSYRIGVDGYLPASGAVPYTLQIE